MDLGSTDGLKRRSAVRSTVLTLFAYPPASMSTAARVLAHNPESLWQLVSYVRQYADYPDDPDRVQAAQACSACLNVSCDEKET